MLYIALAGSMWVIFIYVPYLHYGYIYTQELGVKGPSWLSTVPTFDLVKGMSCDYMHCVLLGVCRLLIRLWFQSCYHSEMWYIGTKVQEVDARLCNIRPPDEMKRTPRTIEATVKFWKGKHFECRLVSQISTV